MKLGKVQREEVRVGKRLWRSCFWIGLALAGFAGSVVGQGGGEASYPTTTRPWFRLDTANFTFLSQVDEATTRKMAGDLERLRSVLTRLAPESQLESPVPSYIFLFADAEELEPFFLRRQGRVVEGTSFFVPHRHANFGVVNADPALEPTRFLYTQYLHQLLAEQFPQLPLWFRHGLAAYYSTFEATDDQALIGKPSRKHLSEIRLLDDVDLSYGELLALREPPLQDAGLMSQLTVRSWLLVHYLLNDPERREKTPQLVRRLLRGEGSGQALAEIFGIVPSEMGKRLSEYRYQEEGLPYWRVEVKTTALEVALYQPLSAYETSFFLGDLLLHSAPDRRAEAAALFERSLALANRLGVQHGAAFAGLGEVSELDGDLAAASRHYALAVEQAAGDSLVQYLYGQSLLAAVGPRRPESDEGSELLDRAISALQESVDLDPAFAEGWALLGYAHGLETAPSGDAVAALERALELLPGRTDIALNLVLAYARQGQQEAAETAFFDMARMGAGRADLARAAEILLQMDYREANRLVRQENRLEDAIALFARVRAESMDPALRQRADERITKLATAAQHNQFADLYQRTVDLWRQSAEDPTSLEMALVELESRARSELQKKAVASLRQRVAAYASR